MWPFREKTRQEKINNLKVKLAGKVAKFGRLREAYSQTTISMYEVDQIANISKEIAEIQEKIRQLKEEMEH